MTTSLPAAVSPPPALTPKDSASSSGKNECASTSKHRKQNSHAQLEKHGCYVTEALRQMQPATRRCTPRAKARECRGDAEERNTIRRCGRPQKYETKRQRQRAYRGDSRLYEGPKLVTQNQRLTDMNRASPVRPLGNLLERAIWPSKCFYFRTGRLSATWDTAPTQLLVETTS